jgi:gas vesicle protein
MADNDDFGTFLAGFVIGGLVGAAVAMLMAPQTGEETRTMIKEKSIELKDRAVEYSETAREKAEKALEDARARADEALEELRQRSNELAELTREKAAELQQRGQVVLDEQRTRLETAVASVRKAGEQPKETPPAETPPPAEA